MTCDSDSATSYLRDRPVLSVRQARMLWVAAPLVVALIGAALARSDTTERFENVSIDWRFRLRGPRVPRTDIVVVEIDEQSRRNLKPVDRRFDLREHVPAAIANLSDAGAVVVGLDVCFSDLGDDATDARLADALANAAVPVVLAAAHTDGQVKRSAPLFTEAGADEGVINVQSDADGVVRRLPRHLHLDVVNPDASITEIPHFPLVVAWYAVPEEEANETVVCDEAGAWVGPHRVHAGELIDYVAMRDQGWGRLTFEEVVRNGFEPGAVDGAVVLIGESRLISDTFTTPLGEGLTPGVYYHANVIAQILDGRRLRTVFASRWSQAGLSAALAFVSGLFAWNQRRWWERRHGGVVLGVYLAVGVALFPVGWGCLAAVLFARGAVIPLAGALAAMGVSMGTGLAAQWILLNANARRLMERARRIESLFGQSVSRRVLDALKADPKSIVETYVREVTVMFCDLRGFTAVSFSLPPEQVAQMLNEYFNDIAGSVFEHDGFIDKFVGDEVMVVFSVPLVQPNHAERAVRTAISLKRRLAALNRRRRERDQPPLDCGIGIHCGPAAAGHIGSSQRSNYTVVGTTVNLAARIERLTRGGEILVSRAVQERLPDDIETAPWRTVELPGAPGDHELFVVRAGEAV